MTEENDNKMNWDKLLCEKTSAQREEEPQQETIYPIDTYEKDYNNIILSASFRRLQDKTQVFPLDKSDFIRTRLTHSIEVSTIAKQLGRMITKNKSEYLQEDFNTSNEENRQHIGKRIDAILTVLSCAGLLHDLGNPPFGHFGEVVIGEWFKDELQKDSFTFNGKPICEILNEQMKQDLMNFEGNAQALRILSKVYNHPQGYDINLTYGVINTLIKYPNNSLNIDKKHRDIKFHKMGYYYAEEKFFKQLCQETGTKIQSTYVRHPLTFLLEAADDIAYATSDLEDAVKKGMFTVDQFIEYYNKALENEKFTKEKKKLYSKLLLKNLVDRLKEENEQSKRTTESDLIAFQKWTVYAKNWLMYVVSFSFNKNYKKIMNGNYQDDVFQDGYHEYSIEILKGAMREFVFDSSEIVKLELSAKKILNSLLSDFIYAVINWDSKYEGIKPTDSQLKLIHIISDNYKTDYQKAVETLEFENTEEIESYKLYLRFLMVTDFISGMTDSYAKNLYQELNAVY